MNETLLLVLNWLPVLVESGIFVFLVKFLAKKLKDHFSTPERLKKEIEKLNSSIAALNKQVSIIIEDNHRLERENHRLMMKSKGFKDYDEEVSKN